MTISQAFDLAVRHHQAGRLADAEALYRQILAAHPNHAEALHLLGVIAHQVGRHDLAVEWIRQAIAVNPAGLQYHLNLGNALAAQGHVDQAITMYQGELRLHPGSPEAWNNLGNAFRQRGQSEKAVAAIRRALLIKVDFPEAHNNLGVALAELGRLEEAIAAYHRALELKPGDAEFHNNLAATLAGLGQLDEAVATYRHALELKSDYPRACNNLGNALRQQGQFDEAIAAYRRALELRPDYLEAHNNLGVALKDLGQFDEAIASFRRVLQSNPELASAHSNLICTLYFLPRQNAGTIAEEQQRWNRQCGEPMKRFMAPHANDPTTTRRLRVGYVSPDFRGHVVGRYMLPLIEHHDRKRFEIVCYSGVLWPDSITDRFRSLADAWRGAVGVSDEALAELIREDRVDILVDLTQHMAGNRLPVLARKPAPVQVSFAGYPDSTGLEAIEYRISDRFLLAGSADESAGKERVCLIDSFWCYDSCGMDVNVNPLPAEENGTVTFGCLNNFCKVNERVLHLWAQVLGKVKDSRLVISSPAGSHREKTLEALEGQGVEGRRVEFVDLQPLREYLELYHRLDIALDTFPYNGGVTTCDALWMGVPVVSLAGETPVSRAGLSLLTNLGLPELVARSESEYLNIAERLAGDLPSLAQLRASLRDRMESSVLMDAPRFARQVEHAYRQMWEAWRGGRSA